MDSDDSIESKRSLVLEACKSAYIYLASLNDPSGEIGFTVSDFQSEERIKLLLSLPIENFTTSINGLISKPLAEVITTTLSSRRRIIGPTSNVYDTLSSIAPSPLTFRSVLSTILEQFFSANHFGLSKGKEGQWNYAINENDNEAIKGFYLINADKVEDSSDRAAGVRVAMLSISRRDEMGKYFNNKS